MYKPILWGRGTSSNVQKVLWMTSELGIAIERRIVGGPFGGTDTVEFGALNPNRTVPVWQTNDLVLWESHAILRHLARSHGQFYGESEIEMAEVDRWLDWYALVFWPPVRLLFLEVFQCGLQPSDHPGATEALGNITRNIAIAEKILINRPYLACTRFSLADISLAIGINRMRGLDFEISLTPGVSEWFARVSTRPGFNAATSDEPDMPGRNKDGTS